MAMGLDITKSSWLLLALQDHFRQSQEEGVVILNSRGRYEIILWVG